LSIEECKLLIKESIAFAKKKLKSPIFLEYLQFCQFHATHWKVRRKLFMPGKKPFVQDEETLL